MSHSRRLTKILLPAVALSLLAASLRSQAPGNATQLTAGPTYTSSDGKAAPKFPNVDVVFSLTDANGAPVQPKAGDFKLYYQGKEAGTTDSIRTFEQAGYGVTAILALDASGSMKGAPLRAIHASISKFVNQARPQDKVEVITFADQTQVDVPFGADKASLTKELDTVQARGKYTRLYDGLLQALDQFNDNQPKRRQIVVISDGHDEGSKHTIDEVIVRAKFLSVVINSIGLTKDNGQYLVSLQQLSKQTAGTYVRAQSAQDLEGLIDQGIKTTRATPVATFKTSRLPTDGKNQTTQLRWQSGKLTAPAFIVTPKISVASNLWIWILGGCFVAGVVLLALSWRGARRKARPVAQAGAMAAGTPLSTPPPLPDFHQNAEFEPEPGPRTSTLDEPPFPAEPSPYQRPADVQPYSEPVTPAVSSAARPVAAPERGRTQLAVFWDAADNGPFARLRIDNGELAGYSIPVTTTNFAIGAVEGNHLILPGDPTVSGQHARLLWENAVLKIEDSRSTNGTYVNGHRIEPGRHLLRPGDQIRIGQTLLLVDRG